MAATSSDLSHTRARRHAIASSTVNPEILLWLTRSALIFGRLDQRLHTHPLLPAILFRERLEAARACAAVDGFLIDPWHLAAELEGLKPRVVGESAYERGDVIDAARAAFERYLWLVHPDGRQKDAMVPAEALLQAEARQAGPLLGAARAFHHWIETGHDRSAMRGALVRFWQGSHLLRTPLPLVAAKAFASDAPWSPSEWIPLFLLRLAEDAQAMEQRVIALEHGWRMARAKASGQRSTSRAAAALDLIAAFPVLSASRLADMLGISLKAAYLHLERFLAEDLIVEVTHRSARRLFALKGMAPLREAVRPPRRPLPGRRRGRPRRDEDTMPQLPPEPMGQSALADLSRRSPEPIDYTALDEALAAADAAMTRFRSVID